MIVLVAEDNKSLARAIKAMLEHNGIDADVAKDGNVALEKATHGSYDAIVLDVMMPGHDGFEVLETIRDMGDNTPVMMLTAKSTVDDKVYGLDNGADDYLTKPFDQKELISRIRAMTRTNVNKSRKLITHGNVTIDRATYEMRTGTGHYRLSHEELAMMEMLVTSSDGIPATAMHERVFGVADEHTVKTRMHLYMSYLKNKLSALHADFSIREWNDGNTIMYAIDLATPSKANALEETVAVA